MILAPIRKWRAREKNRITVKRIAILGFLLALIIALKYAFGNIAGVEAVSFMFVVCGIFLPVIDLGLLVISFNLMVMAIYGAGAWEIMYWIIWPIDALVAKIMTKFTRNRYAFAVWGFIAGFSLAFWYFISDYFFFGYSFATMNIITAVPINLIEGLCTFGLIIAVAPKMLKITSLYAPTFWTKDKTFTFKEVKNKRLNFIVSVLMILLVITGIALLFVYNGFFIDIKQSKWMEGLKHYSELNGDAGDNINGIHGVDAQTYNQIMHQIGKNQIALVIVANHKFYCEIIAIHDNETLKEVMDSSQAFDFKYNDANKQYGSFILTFKFDNTDTWLHGTSDHKYLPSSGPSDYYPMILYDHQYAPLGASSLLAHPGDIIEISYDHEIWS